MATPSALLVPSDDCFDLIRHFEGLRLKAYPDPGTGGAPWTCGYGSTGPDITPKTVWTVEQADARLHDAVMRFALGVRALLVKASTTQHQFDALVSFAYNVGLRNLKTSTLLKLHLASQFDAATMEFGKWTKAAGRELPGLVSRRAAEAMLYSRP